MGKLFTFIIASMFNWVAFLSLGVFIETLRLKYADYMTLHLNTIFYASGFSFLVLIIIGIITVSSYAKKKTFPPNP